jgi:hypothetical protein
MELKESEKINNYSSGYKGTKRLAYENAKWIPIVEACLEEAKRYGEFAGSWVLSTAKKKGVSWFPNLRTLVSYGILKRTDVTRGGRRAYYIMPDVKGVEKALEEIKELLKSGKNN